MSKMMEGWANIIQKAKLDKIYKLLTKENEDLKKQIAETDEKNKRLEAKLDALMAEQNK